MNSNKMLSLEEFDNQNQSIININDQNILSNKSLNIT